jgi:hypothetical protein
MSGETIHLGADQLPPSSSVAADAQLTIGSLIAENEASIRRLRSTHIPQHVGMAAACRALAVELPRALAAQVDADLNNGALAQRWEAVRTTASEAGPSADADATLAAIALLLREHGRAAMRHLVRREKEWAADAYRLEGQADALEAQVHQLRLLLSIAKVTDASESTSDAATVVVAEVDVPMITEPPDRAR